MPGRGLRSSQQTRERAHPSRPRRPGIARRFDPTRNNRNLSVGCLASLPQALFGGVSEMLRDPTFPERLDRNQAGYEKRKRVSHDTPQMLIQPRGQARATTCDAQATGRNAFIEHYAPARGKPDTFSGRSKCIAKRAARHFRIKPRRSFSRSGVGVNSPLGRLAK